MGRTWLALYPRDLLAADAGVPAAGSGFPGFTLSHNVRAQPDVDALLAEVGRGRRPAGEGRGTRPTGAGTRATSPTPTASCGKWRGTRTSRTCSYSGRRRRRSAFAITETELNVMAALAIIGLSSIPKTG